MKRILKYLTVICLVFLVIAGGEFKIKASNNDASGRGYEISDKWEYVHDITYEGKSVNGSKYFEGTMWSWMGAYKYYDAKNKELLVLLLCTSEMQSNQESYWDQKRWNNQKMRVSFYSNAGNVSLLNYLPVATVGEISVSNSVSVSSEIGYETTKLGYAVSSSTTYTTPEVTVKADRPYDRRIMVSHNFKNYKTNIDLDNICCSHVKRNNLALFKISNYSLGSKTAFYIESEATFYRYGKINSASVSGVFTGYFEL